MKLKSIKERHDLLSLLVAAIAVLLSQFPPVYEWFYAPEIEIKSEQAFGIVPNLYSGIQIAKHYSVTNVGEKTGRVKSLYLFIVDQDGTLLQEVRAQSFRLPIIDHLGQQPWEQFSELNLQPDTNWSHLVSFSHRIPNNEFDEIRLIMEEVNIEEELWEYEMEDQGYNLDNIEINLDAPTFKISPPLLTKLKNSIKNKVPWLKEGVFNLYEVSMTGESPIIKSYQFEIRNEHIKYLSRALDSYSEGLTPYNLPSIMFEINSLETIIPKSVLAKINKYSI